MAPRRVPFIPQMETVECGASCLAMVLATHGHHAPLAEVRQACNVTRDGVTALGILRASRRFGLEARAFRPKLEELPDLPKPAILHWEFKHYVVLERTLKGGAAIIVDPTAGRLRLGPEALNRAFTGVALAFEPGEGFLPRPPAHISLSRYAGLLKKQKRSLFQILGFSFALQTAAVLFPVAQQLLVDRVLVPRQASWLWGLGLAMMAGLGVQTLLAFTREWVLGLLQTLMDLELMKGFASHVVRLPLPFFLQRKPGDLIQRLESNQTLRTLFSSQGLGAFLDLFLLLGYGSLMFAYHPFLGLVVVLLGTVQVAFQSTLRKRLRQILAAELTATGSAQGTLFESLSALETVKCVGAEAAMVRRWSGFLVSKTNARVRRRNLEALTQTLGTLASALGLLAVYGLAGREVLADRMTLGVFSAFLALRGLFLTPLMSLSQALGAWQQLRAHLNRLDDVMNTPVETSGEVPVENLRGHIQVDAVSFQFAPESPLILQDISLEVHPGEKVAIVGPSGAGKTSLARVLLGLLRPTKGRVLFDGREAGIYNLESLRNHLGVVLQETYLISGTVRNNLLLCQPDLPETRLWEALDLAGLKEDILHLPEGLDTSLGDNACRLSGGQRQRLALARALAHNPSVLLLDEATSALDLPLEARVHANLKQLGCTRILISHRLAPIQDADRILVMEGGRITQQGTFDQLACSPGWFKNMLDATERSHA